MMFGLPGTDLQIRLFEPVATEDTQYNIVDCGVQYKDDGIDSIAMGGSFHSLKKVCGQLDDKKAKAETDKKRLDEFDAKEANRAEIATEETPTPEPEEAPAPEPQAV